MTYRSFPASTTIVWLGRFRSKTGYGTATRDYFHALKAEAPPSSVKILGIDSGNANVIGDPTAVTVTKKGDSVQFAFPKNERVYVVCHETANYYKFLQWNGLIRVIGLTVHEFPEQLLKEKDSVCLPQELWVPSRWNKELICQRLGLPEDYVKVVPHVCRPISVPTTRASRSDLSKFGVAGQDKSLTFLLIVSNVERKNAARVITAFLSEFSATDKIRLIVKLPGNLTSDEFRLKVFPQPAFLPQSNTPRVTFIMERFSDADMEALRGCSDALINAETSKGFDLDAQAMLAAGKQVVATMTGGSTEFASENNVYPIARSLPSFFNEDEYSNGSIYSAVADTAPSMEDIRAALRACYEDLLAGHRRNNPDLAKAIQETFSPGRIAQNILQNIAATAEEDDFASLHEARLTIDKTSPYEGLVLGLNHLKPQEVESLNNELKPPSEYRDKDEWLSERRKLFGTYGALPPPRTELERLAGLRGRYQGKRCFVIGNGPSINQMDLERLAGEFTFCSNKFYLKTPELSWRPSFYTCLDWRVTPDDSENIQKFVDDQAHMLKFFPNRFRHLLRPDSNTFWYESISSGRYLREKFEVDAVNCLRGGGTVSTAMLQLAAFLGFNTIYLIGTDVTYRIPDTVKQEGRDRFNTGVRINLTSTADDDCNHFSPAYFGAGARWHDPNVPEMKRGFRNAYLAAHMHGIKIYNASKGGALDCIPRVDYESLF
jgi:glycosyltransferase involved in cell wall biosynthesis